MNQTITDIIVNQSTGNIAIPQELSSAIILPNIILFTGIVHIIFFLVGSMIVEHSFTKFRNIWIISVVLSALVIMIFWIFPQLLNIAPSIAQ